MTGLVGALCGDGDYGVLIGRCGATGAVMVTGVRLKVCVDWSVGTLMDLGAAKAVSGAS